MKVLLTSRQGGKTTTAIKWLLEGKPTQRYPYWSRVLVVPDMAMLMHLNKEYYGKIYDLHKRIFHWEDWKHAYGAAPDAEVCFDNMDILFSRLLGRSPGVMTNATLSGEEWTPVADDFVQRLGS